MRKPRPSELAWGALAAGVSAYEYFAPQDELMTHQAYRWLESDNKFIKYGTYAAIGATALHLANGYDRLRIGNLDPYRAISRFGGTFKNRNRLDPRVGEELY